MNQEDDFTQDQRVSREVIEITDEDEERKERKFLNSSSLSSIQQPKKPKLSTSTNNKQELTLDIVKWLLHESNDANSHLTSSNTLKFSTEAVKASVDLLNLIIIGMFPEHIYDFLSVQN